MNPSAPLSADEDLDLQALWEDGERAFYRGVIYADHPPVLAVLPATEPPTPAILGRLAHEYELKDELDGTWAVRPLALMRNRGRTILVLEDPGAEPLDRMLDGSKETGDFLRLALGIVTALGKAHQRGIIHKDIKPANILVNRASGEVRLTGFGLATRLPRERQPPEPPESIAGTLAYMAPEQTGRMNRSIDARSDLYALGVALYQVLTGSLPFTASDPMDWIHCHIAKKPVPPSQRVENIPPVISAMVMKLLAKTAEERYQTAAGFERDLRRCLVQWEAWKRIDDFPLGKQDIPDRLLLPEKLYGRTGEIETLLAAFDRIVKGAGPTLVLVSGYSGIGKSSVVHELHKVLVPPRGLFASGKFDQHKREIPYSTLVQAFQSLVRPLLGKAESQLGRWRDALLEALGPNGQLMIDVVPELKLIIGNQPPVPELSPQDAHRRFQVVFRRFIGVFATAEHPLALFLDDLQWLDTATLDLLEDLLIHADLRHLMLIGAYRNNEVTADHALWRKLDAIRSAGGEVTEITLAPLAREHLGELTADALRCEPERAEPLAELVHERTGGNPFFAIQFFSSLAEEELLRFDHEETRWIWDADRIHAKGYTDNVVDLMVVKLARLPRETRKVIEQLACLGNSAEIPTLAILLGISEEQVHAALQPSVRQELVERLPGAYRFMHDRIQEAAYSLIPEDQRGEEHLRTGRLLVAQTPAGRREEAIFDIVDQLNRGGALITSRDEREQLAELNLLAAKRARVSAAYGSALTYVAAGAAMLTDAAWEQHHRLTFDLGLLRAECELLTGNFDAAEAGLLELLRYGVSTTDQAAAYRLKVELHTLRSECQSAVESALDCLGLLGIHISAHPPREEFEKAYAEVWSKLGDRTIESLIDLPRASDARVEAAMRVLSRLFAPAYYTDETLAQLHTCHMVGLTLDYGITDSSPHAFAWFGYVIGLLSGKYAEGYRFARLACGLVERHNLAALRARTLYSLELVSCWTHPIAFALDTIRAAFAAGVESGDVTVACWSCNHIVSDLLVRGDHLEEVEKEAERGLAFARRAGFRDVVDILVGQQRFIRNMRGKTASFSTFDGDEFSSSEFEARLTPDRMTNMIFWYWVIKGQARFMSGDFEEAARALERASPLKWCSPGHIQILDYHFFSALTLAATHADGGIPAAEPACRKQLDVHHAQLRDWAGNCPATFADKEALVAAEIARIDGRFLDAMGLYDKAIRHAHEHQLVHCEAIANELAARFYARRGFETISEAYLKNARSCYLRWGAEGKVRQLDQIHPHLRHDLMANQSAGATGTSVEYLDLATIVKVSQAVSGEFVLDKLVDVLLRTAVEYAGAERGLLVLPQGDELRIQAEAVVAGDSVTISRRDVPVSNAELPESVVRYAARTEEIVILDDASLQGPFSFDEYVYRRRVRSLLCLPLKKQGKPIALLHLENNLAPGVFTPARISVLKLLSSQAAIALESARLYGELAEREARIRRLVDANIMGIFISARDGEIVEANDAFLTMVGYTREDFIAGRLRWADLTPPEWLDSDVGAIEKADTTGAVQPYEKEYLHKNGRRVPVLTGSAAFDQRRDQGVTFVLDLTERKRAEATAREMQLELAHANRVATMGQLTASIAHEVSQPITAAVTNARVARRWLSAQPPNYDEVDKALVRIDNDGIRATEVIRRIRTLVKKAPPRNERVDINEAILEVCELTRTESTKANVSVHADLADGLPPIEGDRVQLQQVILNLMMNAVEAMNIVCSHSRELLIRSYRDPDMVLVEIRDSGPGLAPSTLDRLFEPFYTTKTNGLGLGLSICRSIVEAHGGRLWAGQNTLRGAVFHFAVPIPASSGSPRDMETLPERLSLDH